MLSLNLDHPNTLCHQSYLNTFMPTKHVSCLGLIVNALSRTCSDIEETMDIRPQNKTDCNQTYMHIKTVSECGPLT